MSDNVDEERRFYERQCLAAIFAEFATQTNSADLLRRERGLELRGIELEGTYPDTQLLIKFFDRDRREAPRRFPLWADVSVIGGNKRMSPRAVASLILTNLQEP